MSDTQQCGHATKWLAFREPTNLQSEMYCVFCEIERLQAIVDKVVSTGKPWDVHGVPSIIIPRKVWIEATEARNR